MASDKKKVCKSCGYLTRENVCPVCNSNSFAEKFKGRVLIVNSKESEIAKKIGKEVNGQYALKYN